MIASRSPMRVFLSLLVAIGLVVACFACAEAASASRKKKAAHGSADGGSSDAGFDGGVQRSREMPEAPAAPRVIPHAPGQAVSIDAGAPTEDIGPHQHCWHKEADLDAGVGEEKRDRWVCCHCGAKRVLSWPSPGSCIGHGPHAPGCDGGTK